MQIAPTNWETIFAGKHRTEYRFLINGVEYLSDNVKGTPTISKRLTEKYAIGQFCSASLSLEVYPKGVIPKAAPVIAYCRLTSPDGATVTPWMEQGHFWIQNRSNRDGIISLLCRDGAILAGTSYTDKTAFTEWPQPMTDVVAEIASIMGVGIDSRTVINTGSDFVVSYPNELLISEVLCMIAAAHGGNWIMTETGKLRLVPLLNPEQYALFDLKSAYQRFSPLSVPSTISRITLTDDAGNQFTTGDDSGEELTAECYYATQSILDSVIANTFMTVNDGVLNVKAGQINKGILYLESADISKGSLNSVPFIKYLPFTLDSAFINPRLELGDYIHITYKKTIYTVLLASLNIRCNVSYAADISLKNGDTTNDEYPYQIQADLRGSRYVSVTKNYFGNRINRSEGFVSEYTVDGEVTARLVANSNVFSMQQNVNGVWEDRIYFDPIAKKYRIVGDVSVEGMLTADVLRTPGGVEISGDNITVGTISAERLDFSPINTALATIQGDIDGLRTTVQSVEEVAISSVTVEYALSTSQTKAPTSGWSATAPAWESGKYMWQRTVTVYADSTPEEPHVTISDATCIQGAKGQDGTPGANAYNTALVYLYKRSANAPVIDWTNTLIYDFANKALKSVPSGWSSTFPSGTNPLYVTIATAYGQGATDSIPYTEWTAPVLLVENGTDGLPGTNGKDGKDGVNGKDGKDGTSSYVHIKYSSVAKPSDAQMTDTPSEYIGLCVNNTPDDPTSASAYTWSKWEGDDGADGLPGTNGKDGTSEYVHFAYATSADGTSDFSTRSFEGALYLGVCHNDTQADPTTPASYEWSLIKGADGYNGTDGLNTATVYLYRRSATVPAKPVIPLTYSFESGTIYTGFIDKGDFHVLSGSIDNGELKIDDTTLPGATIENGALSFDGLTEWKTYIPDSDGNPCYVIQATAANTEKTDSILPTEWSDPTILLIDGKDGRDGRDGTNGTNGNGINSVTIAYGVSASSSVQPTNWQNTIPSVPDGQYLWIRTTTDYTDSSVPDTVTYSYAKQGEDGEQGVAGTSVSITSIQYQQGDSATTPPTGTWSNSPVSVAQGKYLWTKTTFSDGSTAYGVARQGVNGTNGEDGNDGIGIRSVTVSYGVSASASVQPTNWQTALPTVEDGQYLWTRTTIDYTDSSIPDTTTYTYAKQGEDGEEGPAGTSVTVSSIQYQAGTSATTPPTGTWSNDVVSVNPGQYLWTKTTFSDGSTAYGVARQGVNGATGYNTAIVYLYKRSASAPTRDWENSLTYNFTNKALTSVPDGWSATVPSGTSPLYVTTATAYSNTETDVIAASEWSSPVVLAQNGSSGTNGLNVATVFLYQRKDGDAPTKPSSALTYTFSTGKLSGTLGDWSQTVPASNGSPCYVIQATASSRSSSVSIAASAWSDPVILVEDGADGAPGAKGDDGVGIESIVTEYYLADSSYIPTGEETTGWVTTPPAWESGKKIWTRSHITWDNGTESYTDPECNNTVTSFGEKYSEVKQTADKINWLVASGTTSANFTMTSRAISQVAQTLTLTATNGEDAGGSEGYTTTESFSANDGSALYAFSPSYGEDGIWVYKSTNAGVDTSVCYGRLWFYETAETEVTLQCISCGENNYDFGVISNLDTMLGVNRSLDSSGVFHSFKGESSDNPQEFTITVPSGTHYITFKYIKDGSTSSGNDYFQLKAYRKPSVSSVLTLKSGSTSLTSAKISFNGLVTFTDLAQAGSTTINGANITTGKISADRVDVSDLHVNTVYHGGYTILSTEDADGYTPIVKLGIIDADARTSVASTEIHGDEVHFCPVEYGDGPYSLDVQWAWGQNFGYLGPATALSHTFQWYLGCTGSWFDRIYLAYNTYLWFSDARGAKLVLCYNGTDYTLWNN